MVAQKTVVPYTFTDIVTNQQYTCQVGVATYPVNNIGTKPPVVFVHGWTSKMGGFWWAYNNTIVSLAMKNDYFVACVNLDPNNSIENNALLLKQQLVSITTNYATKLSTPSVQVQVTLVCHSKGGLDAQGMLYYYRETIPLVKRVITLSTPFWGSPLCNLIFDAKSTYIIPKLSEMLRNDASDATSNLTTTFCEKFRKSFDAMYNDSSNGAPPFFTVGGIGTNGSKAIYDGMAKEYMNYLGANDDDVHYQSAQTPGGYVVAILPYYHDQIASGDNIWTIIEPYISGNMSYSNALYRTDPNYTFKITSSQIDKALTVTALYMGASTWMYWVFPLIGIFVLYYVIKYAYNYTVSRSQENLDKDFLDYDDL